MVADTIIEGGTLVTSTNTKGGSVAIEDGEIVAIGDSNSLPSADNRIDASGNLVMPGIVDPHVHIDDHVSIDSYETATKAAALGGVTTVIDFAWQPYVGRDSPWENEGSITDGLSRKREKENESIIDFGLHGGILREGEDLFDEIPTLIEKGITSFKMYTAYEFGLSNGYIKRVFDTLGEVGAVGVLHTEDDSVCTAITEEMRKAEKSSPEEYPSSRPDFAEAIAADDAINIALQADAKYYGIHTSCKKSAQVIDRYQEDGEKVRAETCTHYTALDDSIHSELGNLPKIAPPIRSENDIEAIFEYLRKGVLNVVSTDHVAAKSQNKENMPWWEGPFGSNSIQVSLPIFHDEAVNQRDFSYPFLVRKMSTAPAKTFGLPNKGTLEPGTDADIVIFDPNEQYTITATDNASKADYSIYEGRDVTGRVKKTLVRGEIVASDDTIVTDTGHGQFVERNIPDWSV